jgi:Tol biopolymer transport system component
MIIRLNNCVIILPKNYSAYLVPACPGWALRFTNYEIKGDSMIISRLTYIFIGLLLSQVQVGMPQVRPLSQPQRLTPMGREFMQPVWSPTGEWLAITGPSYNGIWLVKPDGSDLHQLTDDVAVGYKMKWSPDGKMLGGRVAKFENRRRYNAVKVYEVATKNSTLLTEFRLRMPGLPQWAGSNRQVALFTNRGVEFFQLSAKNGTEAQRVIDRPLVFAGQQGLIVTSTNDANYKILDPISGLVVNSALSPDGGKIVFEMAAGNLYVCNIDGSGLIDLGRGERPQWSPDGSKIAFMISVDDGHRLLNADIYVIGANGTGKTNLTNSKDRLEMNCTWSSDGKRLAFDERNSGAIWAMEVVE